MDEQEILVNEQVLQVPFVYSAGPVVSRFLCGLRDEKKIYGQRCGRCGQVYVPPRPMCGSCLSELGEWVEVGPGGIVENFTVIHYAESTHPRPAPFVLGLIRLDGAATCLPHLLLLPVAKIKIGSRVKAVFAEDRRGHILDLLGFGAE